MKGERSGKYVARKTGGGDGSSGGGGGVCEGGREMRDKSSEGGEGPASFYGRWK